MHVFHVFYIRTSIKCHRLSQNCITWQCDAYILETIQNLPHYSVGTVGTPLFEAFGCFKVAWEFTTHILMPRYGSQLLRIKLTSDWLELLHLVKGNFLCSGNSKLSASTIKEERRWLCETAGYVCSVLWSVNIRQWIKQGIHWLRRTFHTLKGGPQ